MHTDQAEFLANAATGLGLYYLSLCAMNWIGALWMWRKAPRVYTTVAGFPVTNSVVWFFVGGAFMLMAPLAMIHRPLMFPEWFKSLVNQLSGPEFLTTGALIAMAVLFVFRRFFVQKPIAWALLNLSLLAMGMAMTDPDFMEIVKKGDNLPIVGLVYLLGFFTWLGAYQAVINDDRMAEGLPPVEKSGNQKVLVWPDLVYTELICMVALTALLLLWAIVVPAPLEEMASSVKTPNPSKAPWYFLGLQEMLVYYDPWMAGVVLPTVVIVGLMAIPYLDFNRDGNGYYTIAQRKFAYIVFQIGFLELWIVLIVLGTFLRGPNWNFYGPFEYWDSHKVVSQNNINLSEYFWNYGLNVSLPKSPTGSSGLTNVLYIIYRELPGILLVLGYFVLLPPLMAATVFRKFFVKMGFIRFMVMANLLLLMISLPAKMMLRWVFVLKYLISIPEYFLNF